jgi:hypothetical protein
LDSDTVTLQTILQLGYAAYERRHALPAHVRRAVGALLACRTALLGGHIQACPAGHVEGVWYHSCRHRMCPPCAWVQVARWLTKQQARLLACEHDHVILTMPHALHEVWLANVAEMSRLLFASGHETRVEWRGDATYLGAKPGIIAALHTWTQTLLLHPHRHGLVSGGGLSETGQWVAVRHGFLLPRRVVRVVFRGKLLAAIRQGLHQGPREVPEGKRLPQVDNLLNELGRTKWHVPIRERYADGQGVLVYLARYVRGGPIAHRRLLAADGQQVVLAYEERAKRPGGQAQAQTMRLPLEPFLGRWWLHVPPAARPRAGGGAPAVGLAERMRGVG